MFGNAHHPVINGGTFAATETGDLHIHSHLAESALAKTGWNLLLQNIVPGSFHDSDELYDAPKCHPGTRKAILKRIMSWIEDARIRTSFVLWMYGPAGAGKSAIAKTIAEMCAEAGLLGASFFFSRTAAGRNVKTSLVSTLAYQLSLSFPEMRETLSDAIGHDPTIFFRSLPTQIAKLIIEPLNYVASNQISPGATVTKCVVIDGLDECGNAQAQLEILDALARFTSACSFPLLFLVASRPEYDIRESFNGNTLRSTTTTLPLDDHYQVNDDIMRLITSRFKEIKKTHPAKNRIPDSWPFPDDLRSLVDKASGQFIYASTVIKFIESRQHLPPKRLEIVLGTSPSGPDDTPFAQLDAMYHQILSRISNLKPTLDLLSLFVLSNGKYSHIMTLSFCNNFFGYETGYLDIILSEVHAILFVPVSGDHDTAVIRLRHQSLGDFLLDRSRSKEFWIDSGRAHTTLAILWMRYGKSWLSGFSFDFIALPNILWYCSKALPTEELATELGTWDLNAALRLPKIYGPDIISLLPDFFDWLQRQFLESSQQQIAYRLLNDFDRRVRDDLFCSKEICLFIQATLEEDLFKQRSMDLLWILISERQRNFLKFYLPRDNTHFKFCEMLETIISRPDRIQDYLFNGSVYARLTLRMAGFLVDLGPRWEEKKTWTDGSMVVLKDDAILLIIRILPKTANDTRLAEYLRNTLLPLTPWICDPNSGQTLKESFQRALQEYITRCNVPLGPIADLTFW